MPISSELTKDFPHEAIPDSDKLFQRVHKAHFRHGKLALSMVFNNHGEGMSTDWSKYSSARKTKENAIIYGKNPENYGVIKMNVGVVKAIKQQTVKHTPKPENRAHTDVIGPKDQEIRLRFNRAYNWAIKTPKVV